MVLSNLADKPTNKPMQKHYLVGEDIDRLID